MHKYSGRFLRWVYTKSWRFPKIRGISKIQADFKNSGGFPKYRRLQKIRLPYCLGSAEYPAADFLLVWLKSSRSDPRRCEFPLLQSPSERWTSYMLLLFVRSLPYCKGLVAGCHSFLLIFHIL
jgi:hypothetical protein